MTVRIVYVFIKNVFVNNLARLYVELIRGIPILVLIFFIALMGVTVLVDGMNNFGFWLNERGIGFIGSVFTTITNQDISMNASREPLRTSNFRLSRTSKLEKVG